MVIHGLGDMRIAAMIVIGVMIGGAKTSQRCRTAGVVGWLESRTKESSDGKVQARTMKKGISNMQIRFWVSPI